MLAAYVERAGQAGNVTFVGRLGTYRYLDMDVTIREALDAGRTFLAHQRAGTAMPAFAQPPV
jgi:UDP-galactopyranose mutase